MSEKSYILKRKIKAGLSKIPYIIFGFLPIRKNKIVFSAFEGAGYCCNPKYIAEELIRQERSYGEKYEMLWLVNDMTKEFPNEIIKNIYRYDAVWRWYGTKLHLSCKYSSSS